MINTIHRFRNILLNESIEIHIENVDVDRRNKLFDKHTKYDIDKIENIFIDAIDRGCVLSEYFRYIVDASGEKIQLLSYPIKKQKYYILYELCFTKDFDYSIINNNKLTIKDINDFMDEVRNINDIMLKLNNKVRKDLNKNVIIKPVFRSNMKIKNIDTVDYYCNLLFELPNDIVKDLGILYKQELIALQENKLEMVEDWIYSALVNAGVDKNDITVYHMDLDNLMDDLIKGNADVPIAVMISNNDLYPDAYTLGVYNTKSTKFYKDEQDWNDFLKAYLG